MLYVLGKDVTINLAVNWSEFSLSYSCVIIFALLVLMTLPRDTSYIRRVNGYGVFFIIIFLCFLIINGIVAVFKTDYTYSLTQFQDYKSEKAVATDTDYLAYIPLFGFSVIPVLGIIEGGYYFHNMALPIIANAAEPEKNTRNIFIGFVCVCITYSIIGVAGVYGFTGIDFAEDEPSVNLISENCLN